jgi:hypothetical protein
VENNLVVFDKLKADIQLFVEPVKEIKVVDQESSKTALETAKQVKVFIKRVEDARTSMVKPMNDRVKQINDYAKQISEPLLAAEKHIKSLLVKWEMELEKQRQAELRRLEEERKKAEAEAQAKMREQQEEAETLAMFGDSKEAKRAEIVAQTMGEREIAQIQKQTSASIKQVEQMKVAGTKRRWVFEIEDESLVPAGFKMVDEKKIRQAVADGVREIPGVRIFQETSVAI